MPIDENDPRLSFVPESQAAIPAESGYVDCVKDSWWCVHPTKGLIYWRTSRYTPVSPQCNTSEKVARVIREQVFPWAEIKFVPLAFHPVNVGSITA